MLLKSGGCRYDIASMHAYEIRVLAPYCTHVKGDERKLARRPQLPRPAWSRLLSRSQRCIVLRNKNNDTHIAITEDIVHSTAALLETALSCTGAGRVLEISSYVFSD